MVAENICRGLLSPVSWEQSFNEDVFRIDTRETSVCQADPVPGMTNIPLGNIRESLNKLPKESEYLPEREQIPKSGTSKARSAAASIPPAEPVHFENWIKMK